MHGDPAVDPRVFESTYNYDTAGNLETLTDPFGRTTTYTYDALNRLSIMTRPNGVVTAHTYDTRGWPASIVHSRSDGTVIASVAYFRSQSGEPTRVTREDGSYVLAGYDGGLRVASERYFDAGDRLEEQLEYTYDADGNRTSRIRTVLTSVPIVETYAYESRAQPARVETDGVTTREFSYDPAGRVTPILRDRHDLMFEYDADDHVVAIEDASTGERDEFEFDAAGRRTGRPHLVGSVLTSALSMAVAPGLASRLDSPQLEVDRAGLPQHGQVFDGEHAMLRYDAVTSSPVYYLRNGVGSVIGLADESGADGARIHTTASATGVVRRAYLVPWPPKEHRASMACGMKTPD